MAPTNAPGRCDRRRHDVRAGPGVEGDDVDRGVVDLRSAACGKSPNPTMPDSKIAIITSDVATGRRMKMREGLHGFSSGAVAALAVFHVPSCGKPAAAVALASASFAPSRSWSCPARDHELPRGDSVVDRARPPLFDRSQLDEADVAVLAGAAT